MPKIAAQANKLFNYFSITHSCKPHKTFSEKRLKQENLFIADRDTDELHANQVQWDLIKIITL